MAERRTPAKPRRRVSNAPADAERVSLAGPSFEEVVRGLRSVDTSSIKHDAKTADGKEEEP